MSAGQQATGPPPADTAPARAGRNLPVATAVGLALAAVITVPLFTDKAVFVGVLIVTALLGSLEVLRALESFGWHLPRPPVLAGGIVMIALAYARGSGALVVGLLLTALTTLAWMALDPRADLAGQTTRLSGALFAATYVPFLTGFAALLTAPSDGPRRVTAFIATVVCCDVGGYAVGVLAGRHRLAPAVSPKKTWEGLAGSVAACSLAGALFLHYLLHAPFGWGVLYGCAVVASATLGDLGESLIKRDIGIKDMGSLLPGHGGVMDRLDSLLLTAPVAYLLLSVLAPGHR